MEQTQTTQRVDSEVLIQILGRREKSLNGLAKDLGISTSTFHRWVTEAKALPQPVIWQVCDKLDMDQNETNSFLMVPHYQAFFRRRFLGKVPEQTEKNAIELAKTYLNLSTLHADSRFRPIDLSKEDNPDLIAELIRRYFEFTATLSLKHMVTNLREAGIEVGFVNFTKIQIDVDENEDGKEDAFSVTDQNRFVVFCNNESVNVGKLSFVVAHELAHIFRPKAVQGDLEEKFCNAVASEIIYPKNYFVENQKIIEGILGGMDQEAKIALVDQIVDDLGGEFYGVALRLKDLGFLGTKNKFLIGVGSARSKESKKISQIYFEDLQSEEFKRLEKFWDDSQLASHPIYHYYAVVKRGLQTERMTTRAFSSLFNLSLATAERLVRAWRAQLRRELAAQNA